MTANSVPDLGNEIDAELVKLSNLPTEELKAADNDIIRMISYYSGMTDKIEDRRNELHRFTLQFLALLVAAIGILLTLDENELLSLDSAWTGLIVILIGIQIVFSLVILFVYDRQSKFPYPFRELPKYGNKWKWFYYGNDHIRNMSVNAVRPSKDNANTVEPYLQGLKDFVRNYAEETLSDEVQNNVVQLYLLQAHNYFKNRFYLQLVKLRELSLIVTSIAAVVGVIAILITTFIAHTN